MKIGFDSNEACRLTGVTYGQLDYWDRSGFIRPSISKAKGRGTSRIYSFIDLLCLRTAKQLKNERIPLQRIRKSLEYLKRNFPDISHPLAIWVFLTDGQTIFVLTPNKEKMIDTLHLGPMVFALPVGKIAEDLRDEILKMEKEEAEKAPTFEIVIEPEEDGRFHAYCPALKGCHTWGYTKEEALEYIQDAVQLYVRDLLDAGEPVPGVEGEIVHSKVKVRLAA